MNNYSYPYAQQPNQGGASFGVWDLNTGAQVPELAPYGVEWASFGVPLWGGHTYEFDFDSDEW